MWKTVTMWKMLKTRNKLKSSSETEMMLGVPTTTSSSLLDQGKTILKCLCVEVTPLIHRVQVFSRHCMHWSIWHHVKKQVWEIKQFLIAGFTKRWVALPWRQGVEGILVGYALAQSSTSTDLWVQYNPATRSKANALKWVRIRHRDKVKSFKSANQP